MDLIRKTNKQPKETDLEVLTRMVYQTTTGASDEVECVFVYSSKLPSNLHHRILEWKEVEELSFEELIYFFKNREQDSEFIGLSDLRSRGGTRDVSMGTTYQVQHVTGSINSDVYQRKGNSIDVLFSML